MNNNINQKYICNSIIIYNFYDIYNKSLNNNEFIEYNKDKYKKYTDYNIVLKPCSIE